MSRFIFVVLVGLGIVTQGRCLAGEDGAITLRFKDGRVLSTANVRMQGRTVMASVAENGVKGEIGFPLEAIARADFPTPAELRIAAELLGQNKTEESISLIDPVVNRFAQLREIPGNWWAQAALVKLDALTALGRDAEAKPLVDELVRSRLEPETLQAVQIQQASGWAAKGDHGKAVAAYDAILAEAKKPAVAARAWLSKGNSLLAQRQWEPALFAYLRVPVFFPEQKNVLPAALLGAARALAGLGDGAAAEERLQELIESYPNSPEAVAARAELEKLKKQQT